MTKLNAAVTATQPSSSDVNMRLCQDRPVHYANGSPIQNGHHHIVQRAASSSPLPKPLHNLENPSTFFSYTNGSTRREPQTLPVIIGVAGGTASGKTSVCRRIMHELEQDSLGVHERRIVIISADSFYKALTPAELLVASEGKFNFDHPDSLDAARIVETVKSLKCGQKVEIPVYDFVHHRPDPSHTETIYPANVVIVEGILIFHFPELRELFHMKLFVDLDADVRLARRVLRDATERGRELRGILRQYTTFVKPAFEDFCLPTKTHADIIIPRGAENDVAIELICQHIRNFLVTDNRNDKRQ